MKAADILLSEALLLVLLQNWQSSDHVHNVWCDVSVCLLSAV